MSSTELIKSSGNLVQFNGIVADNMEKLQRVAEMIAKSGMVPECFVGKPNAVLVAAQLGAEVGLPLLASLQSIAVINGRPALWGDGMLAVCRCKPDFEYIKEWFERTNEEGLTAYCEIKRKSEPFPHRAEFSVADATTAKLMNMQAEKGGATYNKAGSWTTNPKRMLQMRARGFCLRDTYADALRGLYTVEELQDIPEQPRGTMDTPGAEPGTSRADAILNRVENATQRPADASEPTGEAIDTSFVEETPEIDRQALWKEYQAKGAELGWFEIEGKTGIPAQSAHLRMIFADNAVSVNIFRLGTPQQIAYIRSWIDTNTPPPLETNNETQDEEEDDETPWALEADEGDRV